MIFENEEQAGIDIFGGKMINLKDHFKTDVSGLIAIIGLLFVLFSPGKVQIQIYGIGLLIFAAGSLLHDISTKLDQVIKGKE